MEIEVKPKVKKLRIVKPKKKTCVVDNSYTEVTVMNKVNCKKKIVRKKTS